MKNKLKVFMVSLLAMIALTGCMLNSPSEVVNNYFDEIKKGENAQVTEYLLDSIKTEENNGDKEEITVNPKVEEAMKIYISKLNVKVLSEKIDKDKATVDVEVSGFNFANIILDVIQENLANAFSGVQITEDYISNSILEKVKTGKVETRTGTITLSKVDKEWKINTDDESFMGLIFGKAKDSVNSNSK